MFEVSFTARQRKNYLFYCLLHLFIPLIGILKKYYFFMTGLAEKYFKDVYLVSENLNEINTPKPGSFDENILIKINLIFQYIIKILNSMIFMEMVQLFQKEYHFLYLIILTINYGKIMLI